MKSNRSAIGARLHAEVSDGGAGAPRSVYAFVSSGGSFGAEASLFAVVFCVPAAIYVLVRARRQGQLLAPMWRRGAGDLASDRRQRDPAPN